MMQRRMWMRSEVQLELEKKSVKQIKKDSKRVSLLGVLVFPLLAMLAAPRAEAWPKWLPWGKKESTSAPKGGSVDSDSSDSKSVKVHAGKKASMDLYTLTIDLVDEMRAEEKSLFPALNQPLMSNQSEEKNAAGVVDNDLSQRPLGGKNYLRLYEEVNTLQEKLAEPGSFVVVYANEGTGRKSLIRHFQQRILQRDVSDRFDGIRIRKINGSTIKKGSGTRGSLEENIEGLFNSMSKEGRSILVVENIEILFSKESGASEGSSPGAVFTALAKKYGVYVIGLTTFKGKRYIEGEGISSYALEPTKDRDVILDTLREQKKFLAHKYGVSFADDALERIADLSLERKLNDQDNPGSAVKFMTDLATSIESRMNGDSPVTVDLQRRVSRLDSRRQSLRGDGRIEVARKLELDRTVLATELGQSQALDKSMKMIRVADRKVLKIRLKIQDLDQARVNLVDSGVAVDAPKMTSLLNQIQAQETLLETAQKEVRDFEDVYKEKSGGVDPERVRAVSVDIVNGYAAKLLNDHTIQMLPEEEIQKLESLYDRLSKKVVGQPEAIEKVVDFIYRDRAGLSDPNRPRGSLPFQGETGGGKTLLAKEIASEVYGNAEAMVRLEGGAMGSETSVSKVGGSDLGYIGSDTEVDFLRGIRKYGGRCVIIFDEIDRAHEKVRKIFLTALDEGYFRDNTGEKIYITQSIVIATTNIGAQLSKEIRELLDKKESYTGFLSQNAERLKTLQAQQSSVQAELGESLAPAQQKLAQAIAEVIESGALSDSHAKTASYPGGRKTPRVLAQDHLVAAISALREKLKAATETPEPERTLIENTLRLAEINRLIGDAEIAVETGEKSIEAIDTEVKRLREAIAQELREKLGPEFAARFEEDPVMFNAHTLVTMGLMFNQEKEKLNARMKRTGTELTVSDRLMEALAAEAMLPGNRETGGRIVRRLFQRHVTNLLARFVMQPEVRKQRQEVSTSGETVKIQAVLPDEAAKADPSQGRVLQVPLRANNVSKDIAGPHQRLRRPLPPPVNGAPGGESMEGMEELLRRAQAQPEPGPAPEAQDRSAESAPPAPAPQSAQGGDALTLDQKIADVIRPQQRIPLAEAQRRIRQAAKSGRGQIEVVPYSGAEAESKIPGISGRVRLRDRKGNISVELRVDSDGMVPEETVAEEARHVRQVSANPGKIVDLVDEITKKEGPQAAKDYFEGYVVAAALGFTQDGQNWLEMPREKLEKRLIKELGSALPAEQRELFVKNLKHNLDEWHEMRAGGTPTFTQSSFRFQIAYTIKQTIMGEDGALLTLANPFNHAEFYAFAQVAEYQHRLTDRIFKTGLNSAGAAYTAADALSKIEAHTLRSQLAEITRSPWIIKHGLSLALTMEIISISKELLVHPEAAAEILERHMSPESLKRLGLHTVAFAGSRPFATAAVRNARVHLKLMQRAVLGSQAVQIFGASSPMNSILADAAILVFVAFVDHAVFEAKDYFITTNNLADSDRYLLSRMSTPVDFSSLKFENGVRTPRNSIKTGTFFSGIDPFASVQGTVSLSNGTIKSATTTPLVSDSGAKGSLLQLKTSDGSEKPMVPVHYSVLGIHQAFETSRDYLKLKYVRKLHAYQKRRESMIQTLSKNTPGVKMGEAVRYSLKDGSFFAGPEGRNARMLSAGLESIQKMDKEFLASTEKLRSRLMGDDQQTYEWEAGVQAAIDGKLSPFKSSQEMMGFLKKMPSTLAESYRRESYYFRALEKLADQHALGHRQEGAELKNSASHMQDLIRVMQDFQIRSWNSVEK